MPGGALEPGETHEQAAARELHEEVGLANVPLRPLNWVQELVWTWSVTGKTYASSERYFLARAPSARVVLEPPGPLAPILEARWWSVDEIEAARAAGVTIWPERLADHLRLLLEHGPPDETVDVGI